MTEWPQADPPLGTLNDDQLLEFGAALEIELSEVKSEYGALFGTVDAERRKIRRSAVKLMLNTALGLGGIVAAPVTLGLSLVFTVGGILMVLWDGIDQARDHSRHRANCQRLRALRISSSKIADRLQNIETALDVRSRGTGL